MGELLNKFFEERAVSNQPAAAPAPAPAPVEGTPAEPVAAPAPVVETTSVPAGEQKPSFDINSFNTFFGTSLKEESELKDVLKRATEHGDIAKKYEETEKSRKVLEEKAKTLEAGQDVMKYFSSPDAYIAEQIRMQRPDLDPGVVTKLLRHDKEKLADLDLLAHNMLYKNPRIIGGLEGAKRAIAKKYDVDLQSPENEWDETSRNMMMMDAGAAEQEIVKLKSEIKLPQIKSPEAVAAEQAEAVQRVKSQWAPYVNDIAGFDKLVVPADDGTTMLEMEVPKGFRDTLPEYINGVIEQMGLEPNPENLKEIVDYRNRTFVYDYLPKILEVYGNNIRSEIEKKYAALLNNTTPPNTTVAPPPLDAVPGGGAMQFLSGTKRSKIGK
jgi:hypothetical protein